MTARLSTTSGVIPIDFDDDAEGVTTPVTVDLEAVQASARAAANTAHETAERIAQKAEALAVTMSGLGFAAWIRSGRWAAP